MTCAWRHIQEAGFHRIGVTLHKHEAALHSAVQDDRTREAALLYCQNKFHGKQERVPPLVASVADRDAFAPNGLINTNLKRCSRFLLKRIGI